MQEIQIKKIRQTLGENQADFGARFGVSGISVSHWELGRSKPNAQRLKALMELDVVAAGSTTPAIPPFRAIQYLGSKQRLARTIAEVIAESVGEGKRVGDLFAGSGVVSSVLAETHPVTAVDVQSYSSLITRAVLTCTPSDFQEALSDSFMSQVSDQVARVRKAAKALLSYEREALAAAAEGTVEHLVEMIEHGSIAAHRQRPEDSGGALAKHLRQTERALSSSQFNAADHTAFTYFGGPYFSYSQAIELDAIGSVARARLRTPVGAEAALLSTASEIVNTVGKQFAQPIKLRKGDGSVQPLLLSRAIADRNRSVEVTFRTWALRWSSRCANARYDHRVECEDVLNFLKRDTSCAAYYADPPYTIDHYSRFYHVLETLVRRDAPALDEMNKLGQRVVMRGIYRAGRHQSAFCIPSQAPAAFEKLFAYASRKHVPLILSYSPFDEGSGARPRVLTMEQLLEMGSRHFRSCVPVEVSEHSHRKLNARTSNTHIRADAERLFLFEN